MRVHIESYYPEHPDYKRGIFRNAYKELTLRNHYQGPMETEEWFVTVNSAEDFQFLLEDMTSTGYTVAEITDCLFTSREVVFAIRNYLE